MNLLFPGLDTSVTVDGEDYPINYRYYYVLRIISVLEDQERTEEERVIDLLRIFYKAKIPKNIKGAIEACLNFIAQGSYQTDLQGKNQNKAPVYDYERDHQLIFVSMQQVYGDSWRKWHWWQWKAAFDNLPENTPIKNVISIRVRKIECKMSATERANLQELKQIYALKQKNQPEMMSAKELEAEIMAKDSYS